MSKRHNFYEPIKVPTTKLKKMHPESLSLDRLHCEDYSHIHSSLKRMNMSFYFFSKQTVKGPFHKLHSF
jgi:hypothetical protein